jgi:hypothetical protein
MKLTRLKYVAASVVASSAVAAVVGIATGAAKSSDNSDQGNGGGPEYGFAIAGAAPAGAPKPPMGAKVLRFRTGDPGAAAIPFGGPPVHSEMVVPTKSGDDFETVTQDNGTVKSVSGDQLTITEGTDKATYKTATLTIPGDANVIRNGEKASLGELQAGDDVHVSQSSEGTFVYASDAQYERNAWRNFNKRLPPPPGVAGAMIGPPPATLARPRR